jgi:hypothetical protein
MEVELKLLDEHMNFTREVAISDVPKSVKEGVCLSKLMIHERVSDTTGVTDSFGRYILVLRTLRHSMLRKLHRVTDATIGLIR